MDGVQLEIGRAVSHEPCDRRGVSIEVETSELTPMLSVVRGYQH